MVVFQLENQKKDFLQNQLLFDNLKENMTIAQEEIFGPVLGVLTINSDTEEALKDSKQFKVWPACKCIYSGY